MDRAGIIKIVKVKLDEFTPSGVVNHPFDDYIGPVLDESAKEVLLTAPLHRIQLTEVSDSDVSYDSTNDEQIVELPDDFLRMGVVQLNTWTRAVTRFITEESPEYPLQQNAYTKAGKTKPVVIFCRRENVSTYDKYLRCIPGDEDEGTYAITYIKEKLPQDMNEELMDPLTWLSASKLLQIFEMPEQAKMAYNQYLTSLNVRA